jgi:hypothetical protein
MLREIARRTNGKFVISSGTSLMLDDTWHTLDSSSQDNGTLIAISMQRDCLDDWIDIRESSRQAVSPIEQELADIDNVFT